MPALPPVSLYVHIPWCVRKCPYCDFNSHAGDPGGLPEQDYVDALHRDLAADLPLLQGRRLVSVFFGGGTPSLFSPAAIAHILDPVRDLLAADAEVTLEANPGTAEATRFLGYHHAGVNRLSLGVQSFRDDLLARIGRIHGGREARQAIEMARDAGFDNYNLDLMYGLPGQTPQDIIEDIRTGMEYAPTHLSWYELTIEPNTVFHSHRPALPDADRTEDAWEQGAELLAGAGYRQYEISAWSQPGRQCRHNLNYWRFGDYLGIGAGAHGKLTQPDGITRTRKPRQPDSYLRAAFPASRRETRVPADELPLEFLMNQLRLAEAAPESRFQERTGLDASVLRAFRREAAGRGLLEPERLQPTRSGWRHLNELLAMV